MSLETKIDALTVAVVALTAALAAGSQVVPAAPAAPVAPPQAPPAPPAAAPAMPAPPTFTAPPAAPVAPPAPPAPPAAPGLPFNDVAGLVKYATDTYYELEAKQAGRGAWLQGLLTQMGIGAANEVPPAQYAAFYQQVEHLKAQP